MLRDAVGEVWLATARCCWQLGGEVDHAEPCWTLSLRCHRYDGDLCGSLQEGGWVSGGCDVRMPGGWDCGVRW